MDSPVPLLLGLFYSVIRVMFKTALPRCGHTCPILIGSLYSVIRVILKTALPWGGLTCPILSSLPWEKEHYSEFSQHCNPSTQPNNRKEQRRKKNLIFMVNQKVTMWQYLLSIWIKALKHIQIWKKYLLSHTVLLCRLHLAVKTVAGNLRRSEVFI